MRSSRPDASKPTPTRGRVAERRPKPKPKKPPLAQKGNKRALQHGARALKTSSLVHYEATRAELYDALAAAAPVRENGQLPVADEAAFDLAARALARHRQVDEWIAEHGPLDENGVPRPALVLLEKGLRNTAELLAQLGLTPTARARLGLDVARGQSLAQALSEPDPSRRRDALASFDFGGEE